MGRPAQDAQFLKECQVVGQEYGRRHGSHGRKDGDGVRKVVTQDELVEVVDSSQRRIWNIQQGFLWNQSKVTKQVTLRQLKDGTVGRSTQTHELAGKRLSWTLSKWSYTDWIGKSLAHTVELALYSVLLSTCMENCNVCHVRHGNKPNNAYLQDALMASMSHMAENSSPSFRWWTLCSTYRAYPDRMIPKAARNDGEVRIPIISLVLILWS